MEGRFAPDAATAALLEEWRARQREIARKVVIRPLRPPPRLVAGADAAFSRDGSEVLAAAIVYDREARKVVEAVHSRRPVEYPYIPGYLGFREGPAVLEAVRSLRTPFGAILFDGMGIAHPRRCGIATHLAVTLDMPGAGVGKSRLFGTYREPAAAAGSQEPLRHGRGQIGLVLRTKDGVRPLFISVGHRMDPASARDLVLACCAGYRLPEPTRLADQEVARLRREE